MSKLEHYSLCGKDNLGVIHPTHIIIYSFIRVIFNSKVFWITGKSYILTVEKNDDWTFLVFLSLPVFPLEIEGRLYCYYYGWYLTCTDGLYKDIMHCVRTLIRDSPLKVQSCKLYNKKYMTASTQITNIEIFAFISVILLKLLSRNILFAKRKRQ